MRDARTQGRQIRRARRDRDLARRNARPRSITLAELGETYLRIGGAIVLDTLAFVVWNIGTRPPLHVLAAIRQNFRKRRALLIGSARAIVGFIFASAGAVALVPALVDPARDLALAELAALLVALAVECLLGDDVRRWSRLDPKRD